MNGGARAGAAGPDLAGLAAAVAEARCRIDRGEAVDLRDLAEFVAAALATPRAGPEERRLAALLDEIGLLTEAVERQRDAAGARLAALATRGRASRAYGGKGG